MLITNDSIFTKEQIKIGIIANIPAGFQKVFVSIGVLLSRSDKKAESKIIIIYTLRRNTP